MAYQTGTATSPNDLLDKLRIFAIAQGWTADRWVTAGSGRELNLHKDSAYFGLRSYENETVTINGNAALGRYGIAINGADSYSGGLAWDRQTGYPKSPATSATDQRHGYMPLVTSFGPFPAYHLFAPDSKTIYLELEVTTGTYQRLGFGSLDLFNAAAAGGGRFFYATGGNSAVTNSVGTSTWLGSGYESAWSMEEAPFRSASSGNQGGTGSGSYLRCAIDAFDNWAQAASQDASSLTGRSCGGGGTHDRLLRDQSLNPLNGVGITFPHVVWLCRNDQYAHPVGIVPGMRYMDMTNYLPGDEFTLGSDTWKVFPWWQKGGRSDQVAIAYLVVT
jgi:hypothetical protein